MELKIYNEILESQGADPHHIDEKRLPLLPLGQRILRKDISSGKCAWTGNRKKDFILWLQSKHPLISIFCANEYHPYSRNHRIRTLLLLFCVASLFISLIAHFANDFLIQDTEFLAKKMALSTAIGITLSIANGCISQCYRCGCAENKQKSCYSCCTFVTNISIAIWIIISIGTLIGICCLRIYTFLFIYFVPLYIFCL